MLDPLNVGIAGLTDLPGPPVPSLPELAEGHGTPLYRYELARVRAAYDDLKAALPDGTDLHYSVKANPHPLVVAALAARGARAEVASSGEVDAALGGGMAAADIQLAGPAKSAATVGHALERGVRRFSVDSVHELAELDRLAGARGVAVQALIRVNAGQAVAGNGLTMTGVASAFGADEAWVHAEPAAFGSRRHTEVVGLHLYAGSNLRDEEALLRQFEVALTCAAGLRGVLPELREINLGGGFGCPYAEHGDRTVFSTLAERLGALLDRFVAGWRDGAPRVAFESGRYLAGDCGTLLTRVLDVKSSHGRTFVILDTGINHLGGMSGLRRLRPMQLAPEPVTPSGPVLRTEPESPVRRALSAARPATPAAPYAVVGPLCTPLDSLSSAAPLTDPRPGDLLTVPNVGAYGLTASLLAFLSHPAPVEIVTDAGRVVDSSRLTLQRQPVHHRVSTGAHHGH